MTPISIVAYLVLFATVALLFLLVTLLLGRFLRPSAPTPQKLETYECGEPPVGSSFVQFDLRFYVVALVFIIFEVEVAFFFPWASVFGKLTRLLGPGAGADSLAAVYEERGVLPAGPPFAQQEAAPPAQGVAVEVRRLALAAMADIAAFFAVLLVGFAYVWKRGDLDWVRAHRRAPPGAAAEAEPS
jgi:NADH-quinone oxidoreductase subunit A